MKSDVIWGRECDDKVTLELGLGLGLGLSLGLSLGLVVSISVNKRMKYYIKKNRMITKYLLKA